MAVFDPVLRRLCVRIVYDGPAEAGKTTNVRQLAALFPSRHGMEVVAPSELCGRTLSFDWLPIHAGVIAGFPLVCHVVSVPGQRALHARRRRILEDADAIVFVCDAHPTKLEEAREALVTIADGRNAAAHPPPLVLQANKQDQREVFGGDRLASALAIDAAAVVEAIALAGAGVIDTFVAAVRAVGRAIEARIAAGNAIVPVRRADTPEALLARLADAALAIDDAAEMFLEAATKSFATEELSLADVVTPPPLERTLVSPPRVPRPDVPPGYVWPAHTGRATLAALADATSRAIDPIDGEITLHLGDLALTTSLRDRYPDAERARPAIVRAARDRSQLGSLLAPDTVLALQPADDGACWLWAIRPIFAARGFDVDDAASITRFGAAVVELLRIASRHRFAVSLDPSSFARTEIVRYLGPIAPLDDPRALSVEWIALLDAVEREGASDAFAAAFRAALAALPGEDRARVEATVNAREDAA